jgi:hypothetical protein
LRGSFSAGSQRAQDIQQKLFESLTKNDARVLRNFKAANLKDRKSCSECCNRLVKKSAKV